MKTDSVPLTFDDLNLGDQFICFPADGDDHGHGGFRQTHWIFIKHIDSRYRCDNAIRLSDGIPASMTAEMKVIKVR